MCVCVSLRGMCLSVSLCLSLSLTLSLPVCVCACVCIYVCVFPRTFLCSLPRRYFIPRFKKTMAAINMDALKSEIRTVLITRKANACPIAMRLAWHASVVWLRVCVPVYVCIRVCVPIAMRLLGMCVCACVRVDGWMDMSVYVCTCMCVRVYVFVGVCVHVYMYACVPCTHRVLTTRLRALVEVMALQCAFAFLVSHFVVVGCLVFQSCACECMRLCVCV